MDDLEPVFTVSNTYFYIAMSLGTPPEMVKKWQSVLDGTEGGRHIRKDIPELHSQCGYE